MDLYILGSLKLATVVCTCLAGMELWNSGRPHVTCVGTCTVLVMLACQVIHIGRLWATWSPMLCFDLFVTCAFCAETVFMSLVFLTRRLRSQGAPGIACTVHGIILITLVGDVLAATTTECMEKITPYHSMLGIENVNRAMLLTCCAYLTLGNFLTAGFADRPTVPQKLEPRKQHDSDCCCPFSKVFLTIVYKHLRNTMIKTKVVVKDIPRSTWRLRCHPQNEDEAQDFIKKNQGVRSPYHFIWLLIRHGWQEQVWSTAVAIMYYLSILLRIPLFHGLLAGGSAGLSFNQAVLLLVASCVAEGCVCNFCVTLSVRCQTRAQLLLQTAVFKKVTCLSAAGVAANPSGFVSTLLITDPWVVSIYTNFLANAGIGLLCIPVVLSALAHEMGYEPPCACLAWIVAVALACVVIEPLLYKRYRVLYRFRDERLKKFTDFLLSIRSIKMSALEGVFKKSLLHLRLKEINQAYHVNTLDMLLETLFSASSTLMIIIAFGTLTFTKPEAIFTPAAMFSCVYTLTIMETLSTGAPHVIRLKSPAFRSCRRLMAFLKEEEYSRVEAENRHSRNVKVGEVTLKDCSFAWAKRDKQVDDPVLDDINLQIEPGSFVGIVGPVGSGKSSLLSAIVGDMRQLSGAVSLNGSIGIVSQAPQILNMSIRDNIIFGRKFDELYYAKVVEACQLCRDINMMPAGDLTEAGDKGEMLSGGQKQRVALARAVYSCSDIYLLDDPTSSQDARVAQRIVHQVLAQGGLLASRTRVLVTNNLRLPLSPNQWLLMHEKKGIMFRDLKELKDHPGAPVELFENPTSRRLPERTNSLKHSEPYLEENEEKLKVIKEEGMPNKGFFEIVRAYFKYSGSCAPAALLFLAASAVFVACQMLCIKAWAATMMSDTLNTMNSGRSILCWLAFFCLGDVILRLIGGMLLARANHHRSLKLHADMLERVAGSALSFFDATPRGRTFNRFSVDLDINDTRVFVFFKLLLQNLLYVFARLAVIGTQAPLVFGLTLCAQIILLFCMRYLIRATTFGRLYESNCLSRVLQHLTETLDCASLIRSCGVMERFCARSRRFITTYLEAFNVFIYCFAMGRLISTICALVVIVLTVAIIVAPAHDDPSSAAMAGLSLLAAFTVPFAMVMTFLGGFWNAQGDAAFQRTLEYTELPLEKEFLTKRKDSTGHPKHRSPRIFVQPYDDLWPSKGVVRFENFSASYRPGITDDTLKGISFVAEAGQKLAVVGRTGAGKSSLVLALLRMIQRTSGMITIDGIDIHTLPLSRLRTVISVIPQDYSMFTGTLRENLDPHGSHSDEVLWRVLRSVHLSDFVETTPEGLSFSVSQKGENLSAGQRQLVALAGALLRDTRILVLDEATSQMDSDTERKVQTTLRESFAHCTVITIAHRIDTILDYDRVVVMGEGRVLEFGGVRDLLTNRCSVFRSIAISAGIDVEKRIPSMKSK
ncbi:multidrug resistance protein mrp-7-like isoform X2 [Dermacentor albipictus]|uniref:multidrug resistance protein mrp-7-like isoform X2 n=1 Tax=Dermacentor albipictus TaxID=60249 RepID=UPI0038FBEC94